MNDDDAIESTFLRHLAVVSAGYPFRGSVDDLDDGDVAVIQLRNVDPDAGIDWASLSRVELPRQSAKAFLKPEDIILSTRGGRNIAYHISECPERTVCSPHFFVIRLKSGIVVPRFLAWQINQKPAQDYFAAGATGSYILNLKRDVVENLPIKILAVPDQQRVVEMDAGAKAERAILTQLIEQRKIEMAAIANELLSPELPHAE